MRPARAPAHGGRVASRTESLAWQQCVLAHMRDMREWCTRLGPSKAVHQVAHPLRAAEQAGPAPGQVPTVRGNLGRVGVVRSGVAPARPPDQPRTGPLVGYTAPGSVNPPPGGGTDWQRGTYSSGVPPHWSHVGVRPSLLRRTQ